MNKQKIASFLLNGYRSNSDLFNRLAAGAVTLIACKLLKIPVTYKSSGVSLFNDDCYEDYTTDKDIALDLPWTNSPSITAIYHISEGAARKSFDSQKYESAKKIYEIASESTDNTVKSYGIKALSQISKHMTFDSYRSSIDTYIAELATDII